MFPCLCAPMEPCFRDVVPVPVKGNSGRFCCVILHGIAHWRHRVRRRTRLAKCDARLVRSYSRTNPHDTSTMKSPMNTLSLFASVALLTLEFCTAQAQNAPESMRFFVTSTGLGKGGDLGGLAGADAHCQSLAHAHVARLSKHPGYRRGRQCSRPHRPWALVQCQGDADRARPRRTARHEHAYKANRSD